MLQHIIKTRAMFSSDDQAGGNPPKPEQKPDTEGNGGITQDELNRQFAERAARAAEAEKKKLFESLGVKDDDEFAAYLKAKKEAEDKNKSEAQKAQDDLARAQARITELEADAKKKEEALNKRVQDTEIKIAALAQVTEVEKDGKTTKLVRPAFLPAAMDEVLLLVDRSEIKDTDGKVTGIEQALAKLAKDKPHLTQQGQTKPAEKPKGTPTQKSGRKFVQGTPDGAEPDGLQFESL